MAAPEGDVFRLYSLLSDVRARGDRATAATDALLERVLKLEARLTNLEPATDAIALVSLEDPTPVPLHLAREAYEASALLQGVFDAEGRVRYNTRDPERPKGFVRGVYPDGHEPAQCVYVCGDDYNEQSTATYHFLLWPTALSHAGSGDGMSLYLTRAGREKAPEELAADALIIPHCPSVVVEVCAYRSLGYEAALQAAVHIAHGRKTFVVLPDQKLELTRFRSDLKEVNFIGPRLAFTERERQTELAQLFDTLLNVYERHFSNEVRRVCREGMCHFVKHIAGAHRGYLAKKTDDTDAGFCASWLAAVAAVPARTDVGILFKSLLSLIITERGGHTTQTELEMAEHMRVVHELSHAPVTQSITSRNLELKNAFVNAVAASPVLTSLGLK
jgi:hypothetical protein